MKKEIKTDIVIIGAGISGLATAHFLARKGYHICILEKSDRLGGVIRSQRQDGFLFEYGPNSTLDTTPLLHELFQETGTEGAMEYARPEAKNRYIVRQGKLHPLPMNPFAFIKSQLFSTSAKLRLLKEPFISPAEPEKDESLADFVIRRLGSEFLDYAINPFVAGVYAGKPEKLSVRSAFPKLYALEQHYGSLIKGSILGAKERRKNPEQSKQSARLLSFKEGMQTIVDAIAAEFSSQAYMQTRIERIQKLPQDFKVSFKTQGKFHQVSGKALLITIPAYNYDELPFDFKFTILNELARIEYPPVATVCFGYPQLPKTSIPLNGFGFLVPAKEKRNILGTIWNSIIFSHRAPKNGVTLTTFLGGSRQPEIPLLPENKLTEIVVRDLQDLMGLQEKPGIVFIQRWQKAIPQYSIGHQQIMAAVETFENQHPGLFISGNFRGGISVVDCIKQAQGISEAISSYLASAKKKNMVVADVSHS